jgi:hypothetical protein
LIVKILFQNILKRCFLNFLRPSLNLKAKKNKRLKADKRMVFSSVLKIFVDLSILKLERDLANVSARPTFVDERSMTVSDRLRPTSNTKVYLETIKNVVRLRTPKNVGVRTQ